MNYWFVCHGKMGSVQRSGGYLFAPLKNVADNIEAYWELVDELCPGDVVFCYADGQIRSVALVRSEVRIWEGPWKDERGEDLTVKGRRVDVEYRDVHPPLELSQVKEKLLPLTRHKYAPLRQDGEVTIGYLSKLTASAGQLIHDAIRSQTGHTDIFADKI